MKIRIGHYSALLWILFFWGITVVWIADKLHLQNSWSWRLYAFLSTTSLIILLGLFNAKWNSITDKLVFFSVVRIDAKRYAAIACIFATWLCVYWLVWRNWPDILEGDTSIKPLIILVAPLLLLVTYVEKRWQSTGPSLTDGI